MKTRTWPTLKQALYLIGMVFVLSTTVACSDKKKGSTASYRGGSRGGGYTGLDYQYGNQYGQSSWGVIYNNSVFYAPQNPMNSPLSDFMQDTADLGYVSGKMNDNTGIRFIGSVNSGTVYFLVWDDYANQSGQAYYWPLNVVNRQISQNGASITLEDSGGHVYLEGSINYSGIWSGTVYYQNNGDSGERTLGQFQIYADSILR